VAQGEALLDQGNYADARGVLLQAMAMRPGDPQLAAALGGAMRGLGRIPMAERTLARALELDPRSPRANYEQAMLLAMKGDKAGAVARLQQLKSLDAAWAAKHNVDAELAKLR
jgi:Flp pilus assembly protein TadD